ncbi:thioesterase family protein [Undibacterium fentianense]|uniref:Thioesterase family protein n=1 Tax=Undibacterium fentianense TaxID=2828728 RepID=A0A941E1H4_9BURK|nr:thioesterase family protein [Undibacterium fentianense]MBR7799241.1 thioesterase family protein [Undibacterium fentianense]
MSFETMLEQAEQSSTVIMESGWGQGRALFGGILGALVVAHLQARSTSDAKLRALTISFVAPVEVGEVEFKAEVLRAGKSVTQMQCHVMQQDKVVVSALASFGAARSSQVVVTSEAAPNIGAIKDGLSFPYIDGIVPEFTRKIDFLYTDCDLPFSASSKSHINGWMRWKDSAEVSAACAPLLSLIALIDAWPPAILQMLERPSPASSLTWTLEFPSIDAAALSQQTNPWWQYRAQTDAAHNGYGHIAAEVWNEDGQLVAISRQTVTVFA